MLGTRRELVPSLELFAYCHSISPPPPPWKQSMPLFSARQKSERTGHKLHHACGRKGKNKRFHGALAKMPVGCYKSSRTATCFSENTPCLRTFCRQKKAFKVQDSAVASAVLTARSVICLCGFAVCNLSLPVLANEDGQAVWESEGH